MCIFEIVDKVNRYRSVNYIMSTPNTVQFCTAKVMGVKKDDKWVQLKDGDIRIQLEIYQNGILVFRDQKLANDPNFFYTTPHKGKYYCIFSASGESIKEYEQIGIDAKTFAGEESMPYIISNGDVELGKAENFIKRVLEYAKKNLTLQDVDFEEEKKYKGIYDGILRTAVVLLLFKIAATIFTLYYSTLKTKQFFVAQNLGDVGNNE